MGRLAMFIPVTKHSHSFLGLAMCIGGAGAIIMYVSHACFMPCLSTAVSVAENLQGHVCGTCQAPPL
jgi:hypothetical protein